MRTPLPFLLSVITLPAFAQCDFVPTITPPQVILCPDESLELTTQAYDSYQWLMNGEAIDGATAATYTVSSMDGGSEISVVATLDGCTDTSAAVLVGGWMFLPPYIISGGDEPYLLDETGAHFCQGDTLLLEMGMPYSENIVWYVNGDPIPGGTGTVLEVTTDGLYTASGAPAACPEFIQNVGVEVGADFAPVHRPEIVQTGNELCASPAGLMFQWYLNGEEYASTPCIEAVSGTITVFVNYEQPCQVLSEPFIVSDVDESTTPAFTVAPVPAAEAVRINWPATATPKGAWQLLDMTGRTVRTGGFAGIRTVGIDVRSLAPGKYWFTAPGAQGWKPVAVAVVR